MLEVGSMPRAARHSGSASSGSVSRVKIEARRRCGLRTVGPCGWNAGGCDGVLEILGLVKAEAEEVTDLGGVGIEAET